MTKMDRFGMGLAAARDELAKLHLTELHPQRHVTGALDQEHSR
jgi:hypothetical protein